MDALKFLEERNRMCKSNDCKACVCFSERDDECIVYSDDADYFSLAVQIVEKWSKEHQKKTRKDDFFEKHPNAEKLASGNPYVCARTLGYCKKCEYPDSYDCTDCWNEPLE